MSVDLEIADDEDLFGKYVSDLQEDVSVEDNAVYGTVKYIADYSAAGYGTGEDSGNYLVLHAEVPEVEGVTITAEVVNGVHGVVTLDDDGILISRITDKFSQKIRFVASKEGYPSVTKTLSLRGLTLEEEE